MTPGIYPGPQPGDPSEWTVDYLFGDRDKPRVKPRCALCGRAMVRPTSACFFNLSQPLGRQYVVMWHDRCAEREPLKAGMWWPRERDGAWGDLLRAVAKRGPGRLGPGLTEQERAAFAGGAA